MTDKELFILILTSIAVVAVLAVGFIVLYNVFQSRILQEVQEAHQKELDYKNGLIANSIEVQERERCRIAKDLHDDIGSKLSIVNLNLNLLKGSITSTGNVDKIIDQIESSLTESITQARSISHNLYPPILEKFGIQSAIESLATEVCRTGQLVVETDITHEWKNFSSSDELHIYRILQELLHNTIKHAKAHEVLISSTERDGKIILIYEDDGIGVQAKEGVSGLGLSSIETRINLLGGSMEIDTKTVKGYKAIFTI